MGIYSYGNRRSIPSAIPMPAEIRQANINSFRKGLRPLILQNIITLPVDKEEIDDWCEICDKMIRFYGEEPEVIDEFRNLLIETAYPPLEETSIMSKIDAKLDKFGERIDQLQLNFDKLSKEVKQLDTKVEEIKKSPDITATSIKAQDISSWKNEADEIQGNTGSEPAPKSENTTLEMVTSDLQQLADKMKNATLTIDRLDNKVDRLDTKVDRYDDKVDQLDLKFDNLINQVKLESQRLVTTEQDIKDLKMDINELDERL